MTSQAEMTKDGYLLVVDDHADVCALETTLLEHSGYTVIPAYSAIEALRVIRENGPPIACMTDVAMPQMSGFDLVRVIRGRGDTAELPVVFVTARILPSDVATGLELGGAYVTKPFSNATLLQALHTELSAGAERSASRLQLCTSVA